LAVDDVGHRAGDGSVLPDLEVRRVHDGQIERGGGRRIEKQRLGVAQNEVSRPDGELHLVSRIPQSVLANFHCGTEPRLESRVILPELEDEVAWLPLLQYALAHRG